MRRHFLIIIYVMVCAAMRVHAEESKGNIDLDCSNSNTFEGGSGGQLTLMSRVDRAKRCYFVSTDKESGKQCCYNMKGSDEDCDNSTRYKVQDKTNCLMENMTFEMKLDSRGSRTCNITIIKLSQAARGQWKSYKANDDPIDEHGCSVIVTGEEQLSVTVIVLIVFAVVVCVIILAIALLCHLKVITCKEFRLKIDYQALSTTTSQPNPTQNSETTSVQEDTSMTKSLKHSTK